MPFWTGRRVLSGILLAIVVIALGWAAVVVAVAVHAARDEATGADAIVVLGAAQYNGRPSPVFRARLDHAAALYQRSLAPVVLVTGGVGAGDSLNEANVGRDYLLRLGLPTDAVVPLAGGHDTYASLHQVSSWFEGRDTRRVLLVSDGFHMLRLQIIARRLGLVAYTSPATGSPIHANMRRNTGYLFAEGFKVPFTWLFQH
ncbi:MAG TPA: YdcF family protein [Gemmatimonadales bacterium]|nr:YdcF family protein [Gemmatimonadales bacterium]